METPIEQPVEEIKRLQRCVNDLVSILALPAMWTGGDPAHICQTLIDSLASILTLDFVYVRLNEEVGGAQTEMARGARSAMPAEEIGADLRHWFGDHAEEWPHVVRKRIGDEDLIIEIAERTRAKTQLAGENELLQMVASGRVLADVLAALCRFVEDTAGDCICGAYLIDWSIPAFVGGTAPSLPASFSASIDGLPVRPELCLCAMAAVEKRQVFSVDLESDPLWLDTAYRKLLLRHQLRSVWSTPILALSGRVLGTFAIYHRKPATPSPAAQELIAQVTHIASITIERAQDEAALKRSA